MDIPFGAQQRDEAQAVKLGQHAVENDRVIAIDERQFEALAPVLGDGRLMPARPEL